MVRVKYAAWSPLFMVCVLLSGCSSKSFHNPANVELTGRVMGGEQPITGATIQLYTAYTGSSGSTSTKLISATVTTSDGTNNSGNSNANAGNNYNALPAGYFTITGDYTCPSAGALVYITSSGGNPGLAPGTNNGVIQQMVALGSCGQLSSSTNVILNEVTTVGTIAALYPYMTGYNAVGTVAATTDYLNEEFSVATEYMDEAKGLAPGPNLPSGYYASSNEVNTMANIVYTCVNTTGATPGDGSTCGSLLEAAKPTTGSAPTDTVGLVLDLLNNPTHNVGTIYNTITTTPAFTPYDMTAPSDFTLPIVPLPQTPYASPVAGTYAGTQSVTLASTTSGVTIYYTTDGTTPTTSSSMYSGPITVSASETVKAIAVASRAGTSAAGSFGYTITGAAATPVISLAAGTYSTPQVFTVTSATPDAAVYVTTDGTTPTAGSTLVTGALQLESTETLKAIAIAGSSTSGVASAAYTYTPTSGTINTVVGGAIGDGGAATGATISVSSFVFDASGNIYIADLGDNRIRKVSATTGTITTVAGNGTAGYAGDNGAATSAELNSPSGVAVDVAGNIYIADNNNQRIRKVSASTGVITTVAGNGTVCTTSSTTGCLDGSAATSAELNYPAYVVVDPSGNLFIADANNNTIRKVTGSTGLISKIAGGGTSPSTCTGSTDSVGDGCTATSATLSQPYAIALDAYGNLYIDDTYDQRIRKVTASTGTMTTVAGDGATGYTLAADGSVATSVGLYNPEGVGVDANGNFYFGDTHFYRIRKVTTSTGLLSTVAGSGYYGLVGDGGAAANGGLYDPLNMAVDGSGNLYIADSGHDRIRKVAASTGVITTVAGNGTAGYAGDNGAATSAELNAPQGVAVDSSGNIYIADVNNNRIRKVSASTGVITTVAGNGTGGYAGDNGAATSAELYSPVDVVVDSSGNLYIADFNNKRIRYVSASTGNITTVAGNGTSGYSGDNGAATNAELKSIQGIALDSSGNLYISDSGNQRIRKVTMPSGTITTVAGNGTACTTSSTTGCMDGSAATSAELDYPSAVVVDSSGNLYIGDSSGYRVRKVTASTGKISTVAGNGSSGFTGDGGAATSAELNVPQGVAVDGSGNLYIVDSGNNRVRVVSH